MVVWEPVSVQAYSNLLYLVLGCSFWVNKILIFYGSVTDSKLVHKVFLSLLKLLVNCGLITPPYSFLVSERYFHHFNIHPVLISMSKRGSILCSCRIRCEFRTRSYLLFQLFSCCFVYMSDHIVTFLWTICRWITVPMTNSTSSSFRFIYLDSLYSNCQMNVWLYKTLLTNLVFWVLLCCFPAYSVLGFNICLGRNQILRSANSV